MRMALACFAVLAGLETGAACAQGLLGDTVDSLDGQVERTLDGVAGGLDRVTGGLDRTVDSVGQTVGSSVEAATGAVRGLVDRTTGTLEGVVGGIAGSGVVPGQLGMAGVGAAAGVLDALAPAADLAPDRAVQDEIVVINPDAAALQRLQDLGFRQRSRQVLLNLQVLVVRLALPPGMSLPAALEAARQAAPGVGAEANSYYRLAASDCPACEASRLVGWPVQSGACGGGLRIGMADTAIDPVHPALRGALIRSAAFGPGGSSRADSDHGTDIAAILVGDPGSAFPGLLPEASLFAADVFLAGGNEPVATVTSLADGLDWLVASGVSLVNVSVAGPDNPLLATAVQRVLRLGVTIVAAAGNDGPLSGPRYPAAYPGVIAVTAVDGALRPYAVANRGDYVTFAAPGVDIWLPGEGGGRYRSGTSFAAAYASGVIAEAAGRLGAGPAIDALRGQVLDIGAPGRDPVFGWGLIQAAPAC